LRVPDYRANSMRPRHPASAALQTAAFASHYLAAFLRRRWQSPAVRVVSLCNGLVGLIRVALHTSRRCSLSKLRRSLSITPTLPRGTQPPLASPWNDSPVARIACVGCRASASARTANLVRRCLAFGVRGLRCLYEALQASTSPRHLLCHPGLPLESSRQPTPANDGLANRAPKSHHPDDFADLW
jgi:hypothetical protein